MVGTPLIFQRDSPDGCHSAFFEDDGETGYFYALDLSQSPDRILDAVHIYNVANVVDRDKPSQVEIVWSEDGLKCALLINHHPHAAFDFSARRGYCRTSFPNLKTPDGGAWATDDHSWSDEAVSWLKEDREDLV
ncbi:MAG: DUF2251 domain-containing protein [Candidatus Sulfotelmatobacter sp.]